MSAPSIVFAVAQSAGPVAARSGAATNDADFASMIDEAAAAEIPPSSKPPVASKGETKPTSVEDAAAPEPDAEVETEVVADTTVVVVVAVAPPPPLTGAVDVALTPDAKVAAPAVAEPSGPAQPEFSPEGATPPIDTAAAGETPVPAPGDEPVAVAPAEPAETSALAQAPKSPAPTVDAATDAPIGKTAAPAVAGPPAPAPAKAPASEDVQPVLAPADAPEAPEPVKAVATPAPTPQPAASPAPATPIAVPAPRPARTTTEAQASDAPVAAEASAEAPAAPLEAAPVPASTSAPVPTEQPRTRDVIDRAQTARPDAPDDATGGDIDTDATSAASQGAQPSTTPAPSARAAAAVSPTALPPTQSDEVAVNAAPGAPAATSEARPAETVVSPSLSTTSRASVETTAQIAAQIVRKLEARSTRFEMALTPEDLGQVDVSLDIDADGKLVARMAFDNPLAATELRGRADELRRQLQDAGFTVADDALSFAERDPSSGQGRAFDQRPDPRNTRAFGTASRLEADADRLLTPARWIPLTLAPDRVDMKV